MKEQWPPTTAEACNKVYDQLMPLIVYSLATERGLSINAGGAHAAAEVERQAEPPLQQIVSDLAENRAN